MPELVRLFASEPARFSELYWAKVWLEDVEALQEFMEGVQRFFAAAAARRRGLLYGLEQRGRYRPAAGGAPLASDTISPSRRSPASTAFEYGQPQLMRR